MSMSVKHRSITLVFGLVLLVLGAALMIVPSSAWSSITTHPLASLPNPPGSTSDQYAVKISMSMYAYGSNVQYQGTKLCGPTGGLNDANYLTQNGNVCFAKGLVGSYKDPWTVYDLGTLAPGTQVYASGTLVNYYTNVGIAGKQIDVSWYYAVQQANGFTVFQVFSTITHNDGSFQTQPFVIPQQAYGNTIVFFAEVYKGPYSAWTCDQSQYSSTAYCFAQSEHYQVLVSTPPQGQTMLSIWVGACTYGGSLPTATSTCVQVWKDGQDVTGSTEVNVNLPFQIIAVATYGNDPSAIYVHARPYPVGQQPQYTEQPCFPAQMGTSATTSVNGETHNVYVLYVTLSSGSGTTCPTQATTPIPTGRYDFEFANTATPPWSLSTVSLNTVVFAIVQIGGGTITNPISGWTWPSITLVQGIGAVAAIFGVAVVGVAIVPRKRP